MHFGILEGERTRQRASQTKNKETSVVLMLAMSGEQALDYTVNSLAIPIDMTCVEGTQPIQAAQSQYLVSAL